MTSIVPETITKRIHLSTIGQSNEVGKGQFQHRGRFGAPYGDPLAASVAGSWWPTALDKLWQETNIWCDISKTAVGATAIVEDWCGDSAGDGTGTPFNSGNGGWDPNGYIAAALAGATDASTHEAWAYISIGQKDSTNSVSLVNFQLGLQNVIDYLLANNVKVMLGFTCYLASQASWFLNTGSVAVSNILALGTTNVHAGADLYTELGTDILFYDGTHMTERSYILAGERVGTAMINAFS